MLLQSGDRDCDPHLEITGLEGWQDGGLEELPDRPEGLGEVVEDREDGGDVLLEGGAGAGGDHLPLQQVHESLAGGG